MKSLFLFAAGLALAAGAAAQNADNWLLEKDLAIGADVLRLAVKPERSGQNLNYRFRLKLDENSANERTFSLAGSSFVKGEYLEKLVYTNLLQDFKNLRTAQFDETDQENLEALTESAQDSTPEWTAAEKAAVGGLLARVATFPGISTEAAGALLAGLKAAVHADPAHPSLSWFDTETAKTEAVVAAKWQNIDDDLRKGAASFLDEVFERIYANRQSGIPAGQMFVHEKIDLYANDTTKCPKGKFEDNKPASVSTQAQEELRKKLLAQGIHPDSLDKIMPENKALETPPEIFHVRETTIRFENGQMDVVVNGHVGNDPADVTFLNRVPVSYSTLADVASDFYGNREKHIRLYAMEATYNSCYIHLDDVVNNDFQMLNYTDNYSPADTTIKLKPNEPGRIVFREKVTDILQARIYTDLRGLDRDNPNGLVQVELSKRFFLNTRVVQSRPYRYNYRGVLNYVQPTFTVAKIESNQKYFIPRSAGLGSTPDGKLRVRSIDLYRHANLISGASLNLIYSGGKTLHSIIYFDMAANIMLTGIEDQDDKVDTLGNFFTLSSDFNAVSLLLSPVIVNWDVRPHPNFRIAFFYNWQIVTAMDARIEQLTDKGASNIHQFGMQAGVKFNEDANGELFFRSRFSFIRKLNTDNYFQAQIGYSFKIFSRRPALRNRPVFYSGT